MWNPNISQNQIFYNFSRLFTFKLVRTLLFNVDGLLGCHIVESCRQLTPFLWNIDIYFQDNTSSQLRWPQSTSPQNLKTLLHVLPFPCSMHINILFLCRHVTCSYKYDSEFIAFYINEIIIEKVTLRHSVWYSPQKVLHLVTSCVYFVAYFDVFQIRRLWKTHIHVKLAVILMECTRIEVYFGTWLPSVNVMQFLLGRIYLCILSNKQVVFM